MLKGLSQQTSSQNSAHMSCAQAVSPQYPAAHHEPRLSPPELFRGEPAQCGPFLTQCEIHFQLQPLSFPNE